MSIFTLLKQKRNISFLILVALYSTKDRKKKGNYKTKQKIMLCREKHSITSSHTNKRLNRKSCSSRSFVFSFFFFLFCFDEGLMVRVKITAQLTILVSRRFDRAQRAYHLFLHTFKSPLVYNRPCTHAILVLYNTSEPALF